MSMEDDPPHNWRRNVEWETTLREWLEGGEFRVDEVNRCKVTERQEVSDELPSDSTTSGRVHVEQKLEAKDSKAEGV
jgi:hypothetical protein